MTGFGSETTATLALVVSPRYWQTSWFPGLLAALYGWRVHHLESQRAAQEVFARRPIDSQEQEPKRINAELHDSLGQNLLVVRNLALLGAGAHAQEPAVVGQFTEISEGAEQALTEARSISHALRPVKLDRLGLTKSLQAAVARVGDATHLRIQSQLDPMDGCLTPEGEINLYRMVQEGRNNIVKHARATSATVVLRRTDESLQPRITDDGSGFDATWAREAILPHRALGLLGIRERARVGEEAEVDSQPGQGTWIQVRIPLGTPRRPPAS